jgi:hypothetical protein
MHLPASTATGSSSPYVLNLDEPISFCRRLSDTSQDVACPRSLRMILYISNEDGTSHVTHTSKVDMVCGEMHTVLHMRVVNDGSFQQQRYSLSKLPNGLRLILKSPFMTKGRSSKIISE